MESIFNYIAENPLVLLILASAVVLIIAIVLRAAIQAAATESKADDWVIQTVVNALTFWIPASKRNACTRDHTPPTPKDKT